MGQNLNNQFSQFSPKSTSGPVMSPEWTGFLQLLNQKLNSLFNARTWGTVTLLAGVATVTIPGLKSTSNAHVTMQIGGTQTGFLQVKCTLNTLTIESTVNTDTGTILWSVDF